MAMFLAVFAVGLAAHDSRSEAVGASDPVTRAYADHDPGSDLSIDYSEWTDFLRKTTMDLGVSRSRLSRGEGLSWTGTRISYGNTAATRLEGNRVTVDLFTDAHVDFVRRYRAGLMSLPARQPLATLNRDEQLAYWLNLYNARVMELLVARDTLLETARPLRNAPGETGDDEWSRATLVVAGQAISLRDIETKILIPLWDDPLVLYGLWQGAIGGPSLRIEAYEGDRVWSQLRANAREFINSNRGTLPRGDTLRVSTMYAWGSALFDDEEALRGHLREFLRAPFSEGFEATRRIAFDLYDWHIADLSGGTRSRADWRSMAGLTTLDRNLEPVNQSSQFSAATLELLREIDTLKGRGDRKAVVRIVDIDCGDEGDECPSPAEEDGGN
jgi:hypothetical protein